MHIDEHVLAAYLSGELSEHDRRQVTTELVRDQHLREWLQMAEMALTAARSEQESGPHMRILSTSEPAFPGVFNSDRKAVRQSRDVRRAV